MGEEVEGKEIEVVVYFFKGGGGRKAVCHQAVDNNHCQDDLSLPGVARVGGRRMAYSWIDRVVDDELCSILAM